MTNTAQLVEQSPQKLTPTQVVLIENDPLLAAVGLGKDLWADENADKYVEHLRKEW
jgi:hypothetical protein